MIKSTSLFDMIILFFSLFVILFVSVFTKIIVIVIYIFYLHFSGNSIFGYFKQFSKNLGFLIPLFLVLLLVKSISQTIIIVLTADFFISGMYQFSKKYSSMEIYFAYCCLLFPLDFVGLNSNSISWMLTRMIRNIKIYTNVARHYLSNSENLNNNFKKDSFYDIIVNSKYKIKRINKAAKLKIFKLDQMMTIRLFNINYNRSNYYKSDVKIGNFMFLIVLAILLISEVII